MLLVVDENLDTGEVAVRAWLSMRPLARVVYPVGEVRILGTLWADRAAADVRAQLQGVQAVAA